MSELHSHVQTTAASLNSLNTHPGENFNQLDSDLGSVLAPYNISHSPEATRRFFDQIQRLFINALVENIEERLPDTNIISTVYPNLSKLAQICLVLPIGTADCERGFSTMKRIKTCLQNQMSNVTINHCMQISMKG